MKFNLGGKQKSELRTLEDIKEFLKARTDVLDECGLKPGHKILVPDLLKCLTKLGIPSNELTLNASLSVLRHRFDRKRGEKTARNLYTTTLELHLLLFLYCSLVRLLLRHTFRINPGNRFALLMLWVSPGCASEKNISKNDLLEILSTFKAWSNLILRLERCSKKMKKEELTIVQCSKLFLMICDKKHERQRMNSSTMLFKFYFKRHVEKTMSVVKRTLQIVSKEMNKLKSETAAVEKKTRRNTKLLIVKSINKKISKSAQIKDLRQKLTQKQKEFDQLKENVPKQFKRSCLPQKKNVPSELFISEDSKKLRYIPVHLCSTEFLSLGCNVSKMTFSNNSFVKFPNFNKDHQEVWCKYFSNLRCLNLAWNYITELESSVHFLSNLKILNLSHNNLKTFPDCIHELKNLSTLNLNSNEITEISPRISNLSKMKIINLSKNRILELPSTFSALKNLKSVLISKNSLTHLPFINEKSNLQMCEAENNVLSNVNLTFYATTRVVLLRESKIRSLIAECVDSRNCTEWLDVSKNLIEKFELNADLFTNLIHLDLSENYLSEMFKFSSCPSKLQRLDLSRNCLFILGRNIATGKHLLILILSNNKLSGLPREISSLTNLRSLHLDGNQFSFLPAEMKCLRNLSHLNLNRNNLEKIPTPVKYLRCLISASFESNKIYQVHKTCFLKCQFLKDLSLAGNVLKEYPETSTLRSLENLDLCGNQIKEINHNIFASTQLKSLDLSNCRIEHVTISQAKFLLNVKFLNLSGNFKKRSTKFNWFNDLFVSRVTRKVNLNYLVKYGAILENSLKLRKLKRDDAMTVKDNFYKQTKNHSDGVGNILLSELKAFERILLRNVRLPDERMLMANAKRLITNWYFDENLESFV